MHKYQWRHVLLYVLCFSMTRASLRREVSARSLTPLHGNCFTLLFALVYKFSRDEIRGYLLRIYMSSRCYGQGKCKNLVTPKHLNLALTHYLLKERINTCSSIKKRL